MVKWYSPQSWIGGLKPGQSAVNPVVNNFPVTQMVCPKCDHQHLPPLPIPNWVNIAFPFRHLSREKLKHNLSTIDSDSLHKVRVCACWDKDFCKYWHEHCCQHCHEHCPTPFWRPVCDYILESDQWWLQQSQCKTGWCRSRASASWGKNVVVGKTWELGMCGSEGGVWESKSQSKLRISSCNYLQD